MDKPIDNKKQRKAAIQVAIRQLGNNAPTDEILRRICADGTIAWDTAQDILLEAEEKYSGSIMLRRQAKTFLFLSVLGFVAGLYLILINGQLLLDYGWPAPLYTELRGFNFPWYGVAYGSNRVSEFYGGALLSIISAFGFLWALTLKL